MRLRPNAWLVGVSLAAGIGYFGFVTLSADDSRSLAQSAPLKPRTGSASPDGSIDLAVVRPPISPDTR